MISLLIYLLIVIIIFGAVFYALRYITLDPPFKNIAYLILLIVFVIVLLGMLGLVPGMTLRPLT